MTAKTSLLIFNIFLTAAACHQLEFSDKICPPWRYHEEDGNCKCSTLLENIVDCSTTKDFTVYLKDCFCMTMDPSNETVVGPCIYTCYHWLEKKSSHILMARIQSKTPFDLNNETCSQYNRKGVLCSKCMDGHGLPVYSYEASCVSCNNSWYNWVKYIAVVYLPLTVFVFIIIFFRLNVNSGLLVVYVTLSQMIANKNVVKLYLQIRNETAVKTLISLYSIWNLEFFRSFTSHFCLNQDISALQVLALDYIVALYPMILVLFTYLVVYWHGRSRTVVYLCRPLYTCLHHFRKEWDVGNSLIEAFATLILLSFVKVMSISCDILSYTNYYYMNNESNRVSYADPSVEYFSTEHAPYVVMAIIMTLTFNILPLLLLCMYPCLCFQKVLGYSRLNPRFLQTLMDAFRGSYKLKPYWLQSFTAMYLWANFISILAFYFLESLLYHSGMVYILIIIQVLVALAIPYKKKWHNRINIILIFSAFLATNSINIYLESKLLKKIDYNPYSLNTIVSSISFLTLPLYGLCLLCRYLIPIKIKHYFKRIILKTNKLFPTIWERKPVDSSMPHQRQEEEEDEELIDTI